MVQAVPLPADGYETIYRTGFAYDDSRGVLVLPPDCRESLDQALTTLPEQLATVLRLRYGLDGTRERTQAQVGREMGLSGSRVGELETRAISYLRHPSRSKVLRVGPALAHVDGETWKAGQAAREEHRAVLTQARKIMKRRIPMARNILSGCDTEDQLSRAGRTMDRALGAPVSQLELPEGTAEALERWGLHTVGDVFRRMRRDQDRRITFHFKNVELWEEIRKAADRYMMYRLYFG